MTFVTSLLSSHTCMCASSALNGVGVFEDYVYPMEGVDGRVAYRETTPDRGDCLLSARQNDAHLPTLNAYFINAGNKKQQQRIADACNVVSSALSQYKAGRRKPSARMIRKIGQAIGWEPEVEEFIYTAWNFDREIADLRDYVEGIIATERYDLIDFVINRLNKLRTELQATRDRAQSLLPQPNM